MKIKRIDTKFCDLQYGDVFCIDKDYYIKGYIDDTSINKNTNNNNVTIDLETGRVCTVAMNLLVTPIYRGTFSNIK